MSRTLLRLPNGKTQMLQCTERQFGTVDAAANATAFLRCLAIRGADKELLKGIKASKQFLSLFGAVGRDMD
jgi:hypothetical protein